MMEIKLKDNDRVQKSELEGMSSLVQKIADKTLEQLSEEGIFLVPELIKEAKDITKDQMILQSMNEKYRTGNVMGFLGYGKQHLVIQSRFSSDNQDYFFQYLLEVVLDYPNVLNLSSTMNQENRLFNMLLFLFPQYLRNAMRKGVFKTYIRKRYNDTDIKGTIDIVRHIRENTPFVGKVAYHRREFSYDNHLMQLIRHTIEFIKTKAYGKVLLGKMKEEISDVVEATSNYEYYKRRKVIAENKKNPIRHAYFWEYRELQRLCLMILQYEKHQFGSGTREIYGILFDGAWLWEEYVNRLIGKWFYHPMNKGGSGAQRLFAQNIGLIYPDFISRATDNRIIADAKYKPMDNIGNSDYLQVLAYMLRFDAKRGFYLYPENQEKEILELKLNRGSTYEKNVAARDDIAVVKFGLQIPQNAKDYNCFKIQMADNERKFTERFVEYF
ncbi:MAG: hypothetical protein Q4D65_10165 [Peptostreptococcaceae bacterium]|nr:hypothetical protein [Peptostreptococcaceae bacterium]